MSRILDFETDDRTAEVFSPSPDLPEPRGVALEEDPYLSHDSLEFSPPFLKDAATTKAQPDALPYQGVELGHLLLTHAADDFDDANTVRRLLRDLREVRMSKLRKGFTVLGPGAGVKLNGVGAMEIAEVRGFVGGVVDGLRWALLLFRVFSSLALMTDHRRINRSREEANKEREAEGGDNFGNSSYNDDDDDGMQL